jgi:nitrite reductase/ring-hydroxylating ferredoxin subunit
LKSKDLDDGIVAVCLSGLDICLGKTASGKIFAVADKAPPTGTSLTMGGEVEGELVVEPQYGCKFNAFTGEPSGPWCPTPPVLGGFIGAVMGGPQMIATFETQTSFLSGEIEILVDINSKKAYEADYWKGLLDAQGKNDGTYY